MCPVLDLKERKETAMEALTSKDHTAFVSVSKDKNMKPESKHEGLVVDILNRKNDNEGNPVKPQYDDATASSSSFGDTFSDLETCGYDCDNEVMSDLRGDAAPMRGFGRSGDLFPFRKKRVTSHWRKFVQPIMWRCKWVELQLRKLESMAIMYGKEIEKHNQTKHLKYKNFELEGCCAKSMPFSHDSQRQKLMKRKIRKKIEESESEAYMSLHNLSSYLAVPSSPKNAGNELLSSFDFRGGYTFEQILWKIEVSQSQVSKMKNRLDTVTTENAGRISSTKDLILNESNIALTRPVREPDFPTDMKRPSTVATFASQLMKLSTGDDVKTKNAASVFNHVKDTNEPVEQPPVASRKRSTDGIMIYNRRPKKPQTESGIKVHPMKRLRVPEEEKNNKNTTMVSVSEDLSESEQPAPKIRSISKLTTPKKAKKRAARARRKSGSSLRSRRTSG